MSPRTWRLVIWPEAESDVADAAHRCEQQEAGVVLLRRFPYVVFYEIHGSDVVILGCLHTARDPHEWQRRVTGH